MKNTKKLILRAECNISGVCYLFFSDKTWTYEIEEEFRGYSRWDIKNDCIIYGSISGPGLEGNLFRLRNHSETQKLYKDLIDAYSAHTFEELILK
jgi:hypothetical protein